MKRVILMQLFCQHFFSSCVVRVFHGQGLTLMRLGTCFKQIGAITQQRFDKRVERLKVRAH